MAAVAVRNGFHFGTAGRWARRIAQGGAVGIVMSNTRPLMPAPDGAERLVGNNPVAIAVPAASGNPIVADVAWSAGPMMKIRLAQANGEQIPDGWATDADGVPTTDPAAAINGMLLPAAGAKGFALAALIDLIAGGLSSGAIGEEVRPLYGDPKLPYRCAHFFLAIDIGRFRPVDEFAAAAETLAARVRGSRPRPDGGTVRMPGDRARGAARADQPVALPHGALDPRFPHQARRAAERLRPGGGSCKLGQQSPCRRNRSCRRRSASRRGIFPTPP